MAEVRQGCAVPGCTRHLFDAEDHPRDSTGLAKPVNYPGMPHKFDTEAILHALEQIKAEMRTLISEVSVMAQELANMRRSLPSEPRRY